MVEQGYEFQSYYWNQRFAYGLESQCIFKCKWVPDNFPILPITMMSVTRSDENDLGGCSFGFS